MAAILRIAHCVESYSPSIGGMAEVVRQLSERMVERGHQVTVFTSFHPERPNGHQNGVNIHSFRISGNAVNGIEGPVDDYLQALKNGHFDVIVLFAAQQWTTDALLPHLTILGSRKVFVPTGFSQLEHPEYRGYYEHMKGWLREFDMNVFLSSNYQDTRFAREAGIEHMCLIPNGAAEEEFEHSMTVDIRTTLGLNPGTVILLHVGSFTGSKGQDEAIRIFLEADTKDAVLVLTGNGNARFRHLLRTHPRFWSLKLKMMLSRKKIFIQEWNRKQTVAAFKQSDLFLFPSLVECSPIVLFECMASGLPFLTSSAGNSEELLQWSQGGWLMPCTLQPGGRVVPKISESADLLSQILSDPAEMKKRSFAGHAVWKERFTWRSITDQYLDLYRRLTDKKQ